MGPSSPEREREKNGAFSSSLSLWERRGPSNELALLGK